MSEHPPLAADPEESAPAQADRNPYIVNFCKVLVEKKGEKLEPEDLEKLIDKMYGLYEYMLGHNMINSLPDDLRKEYLSLAEDLSTLNYEKIGKIFNKSASNYKDIMKQTMKQFAEVFMQNRDLKPEDYSVPIRP